MPTTTQHNPDLLAILKQVGYAFGWLNADLVSHERPFGYTPNEVDAILAANAAIAKATGQLQQEAV